MDLNQVRLPAQDLTPAVAFSRRLGLLVALFTVQLRFGFSSVNTIGLTSDDPVFGPPGYEINLLYIGALVALAAAGPSSWSVDAWRRRRTTESRPWAEDASRSASVATQSAGLS